MKSKKRRRRKRRVLRECLRCGKIFWSEGNFNRICPPCREINANIVILAVEISVDMCYYGI